MGGPQPTILSTKDSGFGCFYVDIGAAQMTGAHELVFTLKVGQKWIGRDFTGGISDWQELIRICCRLNIDIQLCVNLRGHTSL